MTKRIVFWGFLVLLAAAVFLAWDRGVDFVYFYPIFLIVSLALILLSFRWVRRTRRE